MKKILTTLVLSSLLLVACGNVATSNESSDVSESHVVISENNAKDNSDILVSNTEEFSVVENNEIETTQKENEQTGSAAVYYADDIDLTAIGGDTIDWAYSFKYDSIPGDLITFIGETAFNTWVQDSSTAPHNMQTCIEHFDLELDDVLQALDPPETTQYAEYLTVSDIEVLCGGDQAEINRTFASPYAAVSEDGDIYTIFWLAEHDEADYAAAGLASEDIEKAVEACASLEFIDSYLVSVQESLEYLEERTIE